MALSENDQASMHFVAFDLLYAEGHDLRELPLLARKELLRRLFDHAPPATKNLRYVDHIEGNGPLFFEQVARLGLEGWRGGKASSMTKTLEGVRSAARLISLIRSRTLS